VTFTFNKASIGGAVYISDHSIYNNSPSTIFTNNSASNSGGAIYLSIKSNYSFSENSQFINNTASNGGGVYLE